MKKLTINEFIERCKIIYLDIYDYSKVDYKNSNEKVCIICKEHGEFWQTPSHFFNGHACPKCGVKSRTEKRKCSIEKFIEKAKKIHGNKYDYSKVEYINSHIKICIICKKHGEFWQIPASHLNKRCCPKCATQSYKDTKNDFINKSIVAHGHKYDYSLVNYINCNTKVRIICPKHGEFLQTPIDHTQKCGCPSCKESHLEENVRRALTKENINFNYEKKFKWLGRQSLDFYLPDYNIAIECQGEQHFKAVKYFGGIKGFIERKNNDDKKLDLCNKNNVKLLYFSNYLYDKNIITDINELLNIIKN